MVVFGFGRVVGVGWVLLASLGRLGLGGVSCRGVGKYTRMCVCALGAGTLLGPEGTRAVFLLGPGRPAAIPLPDGFDR